MISTPEELISTKNAQFQNETDFYTDIGESIVLISVTAIGSLSV